MEEAHPVITSSLRMLRQLESHTSERDKESRAVIYNTFLSKTVLYVFIPFSVVSETTTPTAIQSATPTKTNIVQIAAKSTILQNFSLPAGSEIRVGYLV